LTISHGQTWAPNGRTLHSGHGKRTSYIGWHPHAAQLCPKQRALSACTAVPARFSAAHFSSAQGAARGTRRTQLYMCMSLYIPIHVSQTHPILHPKCRHTRAQSLPKCMRASDAPSHPSPTAHKSHSRFAGSAIRSRTRSCRQMRASEAAQACWETDPSCKSRPATCSAVIHAAWAPRRPGPLVLLCMVSMAACARGRHPLPYRPAERRR